MLYCVMQEKGRPQPMQIVAKVDLGSEVFYSYILKMPKVLLCTLWLHLVWKAYSSDLFVLKDSHYKCL